MNTKQIEVLNTYENSIARDSNGNPFNEVLFRVVIDSNGTVFLCKGLDNPCDRLDWLGSVEDYDLFYDSNILEWLSDHKRKMVDKLSRVNKQLLMLSDMSEVLHKDLDNLDEAKVK